MSNSRASKPPEGLFEDVDEALRSLLRSDWQRQPCQSLLERAHDHRASRFTSQRLEMRDDSITVVPSSRHFEPIWLHADDSNIVGRDGVRPKIGRARNRSGATTLQCANARDMVVQDRSRQSPVRRVLFANRLGEATHFGRKFVDVTSNSF